MKLDPVTPGHINMAHIPVAGLGGLGLVAMAGVVAWNLPEIRTVTLVAAGAGVVLALVLIVWRRYVS